VVLACPESVEEKVHGVPDVTKNQCLARGAAGLGLLFQRVFSRSSGDGDYFRHNDRTEAIWQRSQRDGGFKKP